MKKIVLIQLFLFAISALVLSQVEIGDKIPNFKVPDETGKTWELKKNLSQEYLVVYFYPAAFTGGCTQQACSYRDMSEDLSSLGATIVGVSGDNPSTLKMFKAQNNLNFTLLSDENGDIAGIFGVPTREGTTITREIDGKSFDLSRGATIQRWTFILDKQGKLIYKDAAVNASEDSRKVTEFIQSL
jgi:peroxiredoxin Q/BCP